MGITSSNKVLSANRIECGGTFQVTLSLTAAPDIIANPTDIVLVLDRSGSMAGSALASLKLGAKTFIDIIADATGGTQMGQIGFGSRIGIVSFASTATKDTGLITSVADLKSAVDALNAAGSTNHADAFTKAVELLTPPSGNDRVIVMFTDGETTVGGNPSPIAAAARASGIVIYAIGLAGEDGVDVAALEGWASKPPSAFVAITPDDAELEELFAELARNITKPGATGIRIEDVLNDCFEIVSLCAPTKGTASMTGPRSLRWEIDELGMHASEGASLTFTVRHSGTCTGEVGVNDSITYSDHEGNHVTFPSPEITVDCGTDVLPEACTEPVDITIHGCEDAIEFDAGEISMQSLGCVLQLSVTIKNVCPHRRVALAAIVTEVDEHGLEFRRGLKTATLPAHNHPTCRDVHVRCIKFVLPEDFDVSGSDGAICSERKFKARFIAHYVDNDFACCDIVL